MVQLPREEPLSKRHGVAAAVLSRDVRTGQQGSRPGPPVCRRLRRRRIRRGRPVPCSPHRKGPPTPTDAGHARRWSRRAVQVGPRQRGRAGERPFGGGVPEVRDSLPAGIASTLRPRTTPCPAAPRPRFRYVARPPPPARRCGAGPRPSEPVGRSGVSLGSREIHWAADASGPSRESTGPENVSNAESTFEKVLSAGTAAKGSPCHVLSH